MPSNRTGNRLLPWGACLLIASLLVSCSAPKPPPSVTAPSSSIEYASTPIGGAVQGRPWIAHLKATDLDQDGLTDFVACDAKLNTVFFGYTSPMESNTKRHSISALPRFSQSAAE